MVLVAGAAAYAGAPTPVIFVILVYLIHTMAELCFSPVGLAAMTRLSLPSMTGLMMGTGFLATAAGNFIAGLIAQATGGEGAGPDKVLDVYTRIGWFSIGIGVVVLVVSPFVAKLMHLDLLKAEGALAGTKELAEPAAAGVDTRLEQKPL